MNTLNLFIKKRLSKLFCYLLTAFLSFSASVVVADTIDSVAQTPLLLGGGGVPGNLVLTPSVEYPTVISMANLGEYNNNKNYPGYFDNKKCYDYKTTDGGYFAPQNTNFTSSRNCSGKWSGNFLNWATTQTIDPFRKALTGGYRNVDTPTQTILQKATRSNKGNSGLSTNLNNKGNYLPSTLKDRSFNSITLTSSELQFKYGSTTSSFKTRVEVCNKNFPEENCVQYGNNYKPEGLLQKYSNDIRYSVFSYLNINGNAINGGVLRASQDYIGEFRREVGTAGRIPNTKAEWDTSTGVIYTNPHNDPIGNSGVLNYLNKFGEISGQLKSNDPVSELYYAAIRYLRGEPNLSDYTYQADNDLKKDYFPVITNWQDPIQYSCQKNAILGIGDVNTHEDRNLLPSDDNSFMNLPDYTKKIFTLEGINNNAGSGDVFSGRGNSAYIAGLAYWANTNDMRPDLSGKQTAQTYWVDVRELGVLQPKHNNQYWLAAKYGGFTVPANYTAGTAIAEENWHTNGEILASNDKRPDNFFVGDDADNMVSSLEQAFAKIVADTQSSLTSIATNSSRLDTDTAIYQSKLNSNHWAGDLVARTIDADGNVEDDEAWSAAAKLNSVTPANRNIYTIKPANTTTGNFAIAKDGIKFEWAVLTTDLRNLLKNSGESDTQAQNRLNYLRGDRSNESSTQFRPRSSRLGDIVNSDPQFVYKQNYGYNRLNWSGSVGDKYTTFRASTDYQARVPMVLVGANDGMLHAFEASTGNSSSGQELFAYVPNNIFANLKELSDPLYEHRYFVDGTPRISDAWYANNWHTVAVGTTGAGGNSIFALDITNIKNKNSFNSSNILWEFTHDNLGYTIGQPAIVPLPNKKFGVIISSGYHNTSTSNGYVWILDIEDGSIIKEITLPGASGLGAPLAVDLSTNGEADRIYLGDTKGQLWRVDLASSSTANWRIPSSLNNGPLFVAKNNSNQVQPITAPLSSAFNKNGEHLIVFGTGSYFRDGDNDLPINPQVESVYGIFDRGVLIPNRSTLLKQEIIQEGSINGQQVRAISDNRLTSTHNGWYMDLTWTTSKGGPGAKGERLVSKITVLSGRALFTTMIPANDPCIMGGTSMIMAIDLFTGGRLIQPYFDINEDGDINEDDNFTDANGDKIPWSGISKPEDGVIKGAATLQRWICFSGSNDSGLRCIPVSGSQREGRQSWQELKP